MDYILKKKWFTATNPANPKKATVTLTFTGVPVAAETVTIGADVYEFVAAAENVDEPTNIPVILGETFTADNAVTKLAEAVSSNSAIVDAVGNTTADTVVITYNKVGTAGNDVAIATTATNASFGAEVTKLSGGQYGTPCPEAGSLIFVTPYYYVCTIAGNKDDVEWKRFTPASY